MWMFMTILITLCLVVTFGALTVFIVSFLIPAPIPTGDTGFTGFTGFTGLSGATETKQLDPDTLKLTGIAAALDPSDKTTSMDMVPIHVIHTVDWNRESGRLNASYTTSLEKVQFAVYKNRKSSSGISTTKPETSWPIWTSPIIRNPQPLSAYIRDRGSLLYEPSSVPVLALAPAPVPAEAKEEYTFLLSLEDPDKKTSLASFSFR